MLKISVSVTGCFSGKSHCIEFISEEPSLVQISSSFGVTGNAGKILEYPVASALAYSFRDAITEIIAKPEQLRGDRSTTVYQAAVVIDGRAISVKSAEMPIEQLIDIVEDPRTSPELRQKIESALNGSYHNWAHELFRITDAFVKEYTHDNDD